MRTCLYCHSPLKTYQQKYCSNLCQAKLKRQEFIHQWKTGKVNGTIGINARTISGHIRKYLSTIYGQRCSLCGWAQINKFTGKVPVEIDHINGNAEDNSINNLRLICPNCHSLSSNFRNLNNGHGRLWRKNKYLKN